MFGASRTPSRSSKRVLFSGNRHVAPVGFVTPYKTGKRPKKQSSKPSISSSAHKTVTNEEFSSMLEISEPERSEPSLLGQSLYDLSLDLRSLNDVLNQIKDFKMFAPLHLYRYMSAIELLRAAVKCPPDTIFLLLTVAGKMVKLENYAKPVYLHELIDITKEQINGKYIYRSMKDQKKARDKLQKLLKRFQGALTMEKKNPEGQYSTVEMEKMMEENKRKRLAQKKNQTEEKKEPSPQQQPPSPRRKKVKVKKKKKNDFKNSQPPSPSATPPPSPGSKNAPFPKKKNDVPPPPPLEIPSDTDKKENIENNEKLITQNRSLSRDLKLNFPTDFDSSLNSSSFLNILGSALNDMDDNASQTTNQSGINSISKELRDVLFNDESNENEDAFSRASKIATVNTYDAADYDGSPLNFKEEEDLSFLRSPSSCSLFSNTSNTNPSILVNSENKKENNDKRVEIAPERTESFSPNHIDMDSLSEEPNSIDDDEIDADQENVIVLNKLNDHSGNPYTTRSIESLSEGSKISNPSPNSQKLSTGTQGSLSSDYSSLNSPRVFRPVVLTQSERVHIDILPDKSLNPVTKGVDTISFALPFSPPREPGATGLSLALSRSPKYKSIERFLLSKDNIYQRRTRGAKLFDGLSPEKIQQICELAKLFNAWNTAYNSSKVVWDTMKKDDNFDIDILLSQIAVSYGDFLIEGLKTFAKQEGIHIKDIVSPK